MEDRSLQIPIGDTVPVTGVCPHDLHVSDQFILPARKWLACFLPRSPQRGWPKGAGHLRPDTGCRHKAPRTHPSILG